MSGLKRYTQLPYLLHMLATHTITLVNPTTWDDRNDAHNLAQYRERNNLKSVFVMCLTKAGATYHHWHIFASSAAGVRIEFHEVPFNQWVKKIPNAQMKPVEYLRLREVEGEDLPGERLPFVKRIAFRDEGEVRLVVDERDEELPYKSFPFDYSMIKEIVLSPWLPAAIHDTLKSTLRLICANEANTRWLDEGALPFNVRPTTLLANKTFMSSAGKA